MRWLWIFSLGLMISSCNTPMFKSEILDSKTQIFYPISEEAKSLLGQVSISVNRAIFSNVDGELILEYPDSTYLLPNQVKVMPENEKFTVSNYYKIINSAEIMNKNQDIKYKIIMQTISLDFAEDDKVVLCIWQPVKIPACYYYKRHIVD